LLGSTTSPSRRNSTCRSATTSLRCQNVLVIRFNPKSAQRSLDVLRLGLIPDWAKDPKIGYRTINARLEPVHTTPSFREAFKKRRCLIRLTATMDKSQPFALTDVAIQSK
jgi:putative SOS response-associated peptidase YedK